MPVNHSLPISVVVCAYTEARWDELNCSLDSLFEQTVPALEIVLVIDHNPALLERCRQSFSGITIIENANARGLSGARNSGVAASSGDVVAFIDEDAMAAPDWLESLAALYTDDSVLAAGGSISPQWIAARPRWFPDEFLWVVGCTYLGLPDVVTPVRNLIGCNMSIRRVVLEAVGGFRIGRVGALSIGQENDETEICVRIHTRFPDGVILYDPRARVVNHRVPPSRTAPTYFVKRCFSEGISKSRLAASVGHGAGLSSERTYVSRTLPRGVARGVIAALRGRPSEALRSVAIFVGLAITVSGFCYGRVRRWAGLDPTVAVAPPTAVTARDRGRGERENEGS